MKKHLHTSAATVLLTLPAALAHAHPAALPHTHPEVAGALAGQGLFLLAAVLLISIGVWLVQPRL